jgi:uncharacterized membrane protein
VKAHVSRTLRSVQRSILAGIITIGPLFVTYLIFSFLLGELANAGLPAVRLLAQLLPVGWFRYTWIQPVMAILLTLIVLGPDHFSGHRPPSLRAVRVNS